MTYLIHLCYFRNFYKIIDRVSIMSNYTNTTLEHAQG